MGVEIERKFLLKNSDWKKQVDTVIHIQQGYLCSDKEKTVRIRVSGKRAWITIKGESIGMSRAEFEYDIPFEEGSSLIGLCEKPIIDKKRYIIKTNEVIWEIDEFAGLNSGLTIAEVELENEEKTFDLPEWLGKEVTGDPKYYNSSLIKNPFTKW